LRDSLGCEVTVVIVLSGRIFILIGGDEGIVCFDRGSLVGLGGGTIDMSGEIKAD